MRIDIIYFSTDHDFVIQLGSPSILPSVAKVLRMFQDTDIVCGSCASPTKQNFLFLDTSSDLLRCVHKMTQSRNTVNV